MGDLMTWPLGAGGVASGAGAGAAAGAGTGAAAGWTGIAAVARARLRLMRTDSSPSLISISSILERSEEHTSELQSRGHLVCRLLLEKKKRLVNFKSILMVIYFKC